MRKPEPHLRGDRPRIFGIGLNKTGTTSFDVALTMLGFRSLHDGGATVQRAVQRAIEVGAPLLSNLDPRFDAFSDIGLLSRRYCRLDSEYPQSRFVLTTRPVDEWIVSRRHHVEANRRRQAAGTYAGEFLTIDEAAWSDEWERHVEGVRRYFGVGLTTLAFLSGSRDDLDLRRRFRRRPRFLEIDLTRNAGWGALCTFLGLPEPAVPFPWANCAETQPVP